MQQDEKDAIIEEFSQEIAAEPPETEEEQQLVEGLALSEQAGRIKNSADTYNLAQDMEEDFLREIGQEVANGFKDDEDSRSEWLAIQKFWLALDSQQDYAENSSPERDWGATESVPILTEACNQFQARTYKAFFPQDTFVSAIPVQKAKTNRQELEARAKRVGDHMSYQLGFQDRTYRQDKDALFRAVARHGSFFTKTYFNEKLKRAKVDNVRPTDLVINYSVGPIRIEDVRRKSHIIYTTVGDTEQAARNGFLISAAAPSHQDGDNIYNIKVDEVTGLTAPNASLKQDKPAILVEQHFYLDLDGNGYRPYIVTVDLGTRRVKRMIIGYDASPDGTPLKDYEQTQYFTHYKYRENPDGFYGLGIGHDIGDINSAVNIMLRQSIDAATLANDGNNSGFMSERLGIEGDDVTLTLGKFRKVPDTVGDFQNSIMKMEFPGPNEVLLKIMQELDLRAQRMTSTTEATTGTTDKVLQPTTLLTQIDQALEPMSSAQMRLANSMTDEFQKIYKINQKFLPAVEAYMVNDVPEIITRADYASDMLVVPIFDPKFATQAQKVARSQAEAQVVMQNPLTGQRPQVLDAITRRQLEALDSDNIDELVPGSDPIRIDNPFEENMNFLMPPGTTPAFDAFPDQDHMAHLAIHQQVLEAIVLPEQQQALMLHQLKHQAYAYGVMNGVIPPGNIANPALAAGQDNQMDIGEPPQEIPMQAPFGGPQIA